MNMMNIEACTKIVEFMTRVGALLYSSNRENSVCSTVSFLHFCITYFLFREFDSKFKPFFGIHNFLSVTMTYFWKTFSLLITFKH